MRCDVVVPAIDLIGLKIGCQYGRPVPAIEVLLVKADSNTSTSSVICRKESALCRLGRVERANMLRGVRETASSAGREGHNAATLAHTD